MLKSRHITVSLRTQSIPNNIVFRKQHIPNKHVIAFAIATMKMEDATHCNCFQFFHACLQRIVVTCRGGDLRDEQAWQFPEV